MEMEISPWMSTVSIIFTIVLALGGLFLVVAHGVNLLGGGRRKTELDGFREEIQGLRERMARIEGRE